MVSSKLFQPIRVGNMQLTHRVVLAPMTRLRTTPAGAPLPHVTEYYKQRAGTPATLLITEGTGVSSRASGMGHVPGIWSDEQISAWKRVVDGVHAKGSYIFLQIAALGRLANPAVLAADGFPFVSASDIPASPDGPAPIPLTTEDIKEYVEMFATAAANAVHKAGFDGVELHGANGYLINQFLHDSSNVRTDAYGGSPENRTRFILELLEGVVNAVGQERTALRISPWLRDRGMYFADPKPTYSHLVREIHQRFPNFAYLHVVEARADEAAGTPDQIHANPSNDFIRELWGGKPLISAGGYVLDNGLAAAEATGDLIAFGRPYLANPDLPYRLLNNIALTKGDRSMYYRPGSVDPKGYTDYPAVQPIVVQ